MRSFIVVPNDTRVVSDMERLNRQYTFNENLNSTCVEVYYPVFMK